MKIVGVVACSVEEFPSLGADRRGTEVRLAKIHPDFHTTLFEKLEDDSCTFEYHRPGTMYSYVEVF